MDFSLDGKLASIDVPKSKALQPLFEAVVNAFQAISELKSKKGRGRIEIVIHREATLDPAWPGCVTGFTITDDGEGFTQHNLKSFFTAYSQHKLRLGAKGIGRFTYLKVFNSVEIDSHFHAGGSMLHQQLSFPKVGRLIDVPPSTPSHERTNRTTVELRGMREPWRSHCESTPEAIATGILAHGVPYFLNPDGPIVEIIDDGEKLRMNDQFEATFQKVEAREFVIQGQRFELTGFKLKTGGRGDSKHRLIYASNYRAVHSEALTNDIPSIGDKQLSGDDGDKFVYVGFVQGEYLNQHTNPDRLHFTFPMTDASSHGLFQDDPDLIRFPAIRSAAIEAAKLDLAPFLKQAADEAEKRVRRFIKKTPELRPMLKNLERFIHLVPSDASESKINEVLQQQRYVEERELRKAHARIIKQVTAVGKRPEDYEQQVENYLVRANELGKSSLARYIVHRKVMLEFLAKSLAINPTTADYDLERVLHEIIYPMRVESTDVPYEQQNLWIIDERLAFHGYLASDKQLSNVSTITSASKSRPDMMIFGEATSFAPDDDVISSVVVVEFKRPGRTDFGDEDPIDQAHRMVSEIRSGKRKMDDGRAISVNNPMIPAFVYIVCDDSPELLQLAARGGLRRSSDGAGFFGYFDLLQTYVEIIPYNKMLGDAKKRNRVLFRKLQIEH